MRLIVAENLARTYKTGDVEVTALKGVYFMIEKDSFVCFVGPSGRGKMTPYCLQFY